MPTQIYQSRLLSNPNSLSLSLSLSLSVSVSVCYRATYLSTRCLHLPLNKFGVT